MCYPANEMGKTIASEHRESSTARVPAVPPGTAIVYTRYEQEKSVVLNPQDFYRLVALDDALADVAFDRIEMSELVLEAHRLEDTPSDPIEDPSRIKALLGL